LSAELRPRINIISELEKDEIIERIKNKVEDPDTPCSGWAKEGYALICAPEIERHIWTPQLNLQIDEIDGKTEVRGVIGPSASVWTAFAFTFSLLGFIAFVSLFWGLSRLSLDYSAHILWVVPIALVLILVVYLIARIGQQMTQNQVRQLKNIIETLLNEKST
jgi:fatty acid desaturase